MNLLVSKGPSSSTAINIVFIICEHENYVSKNYVPSLGEFKTLVIVRMLKQNTYILMKPGARRRKLDLISGYSSKTKV